MIINKYILDIYIHISNPWKILSDFRIFIIIYICIYIYICREWSSALPYTLV